MYSTGRNQTFVSDLIFVVPIALSLGVGLAVGHPAAGMIVSGGALMVGFGAKQTIDSSRLLPMIFASAGIAFSTFVGMVAGHGNLVLVSGCGVLGFRLWDVDSAPGRLRVGRAGWSGRAAGGLGVSFFSEAGRGACTAASGGRHAAGAVLECRVTSLPATA